MTKFAARETLHAGRAADFFEELPVLGIVDLDSVIVIVSGVALSFGQSFGEVRGENAAERGEGPVDGECPFTEATRASILFLVKDGISYAGLSEIELAVTVASFVKLLPS